MNNEPKILLKTKRGDYDDCIYWGSFFIADKTHIIKQYGIDKKTICFMRSLAKPIQASIMFDYNIINDFKLKDYEIAMFSASHAGSYIHIKVLKNLMKRFNIKISDLELEKQYPLDIRGFNKRKTKLHNNCSGKHLMMILMSKYLGYDIKNYTNENHPIQKLIYKKQTELSEYKSDILTYDGCSTPLWALPLENIIKAYFNLFHDKKYNILFKSILNNSCLFGGYDRLDSEIIDFSKGNLFAKTGAGGFILIYNFKEDKILLVKMAQNNNEIRKLITLKLLNDLNWLNVKPAEYEENQKKQKVAKYCYEFEPQLF